MILRAMQTSDVRAVAELAKEAFAAGYPFDWTANANALFGWSLMWTR
ncbi:MAG: hypothetical protein JSW34_09305 [Candidatus Zixiibacteriota bacterium]|nr:MAG: hypothetical protein JSW34_09305 [candidate division Zixibacteria bacterium]